MGGLRTLISHKIDIQSAPAEGSSRAYLGFFAKITRCVCKIYGNKTCWISKNKIRCRHFNTHNSQPGEVDGLWIIHAGALGPFPDFWPSIAMARLPGAKRDVHSRHGREIRGALRVRRDRDCDASVPHRTPWRPEQKPGGEVAEREGRRRRRKDAVGHRFWMVQS